MGYSKLVRHKQVGKALFQLFLPAVIDDYKRSDRSSYSTKSWGRMSSLRQFRWFALKHFFDLYFKYFINLQILELGVALPRCPPWLPVLFRIRIFGFRSGRFMRFFWIRSRIGYHFCSSRIRIRIIQNGLNTFYFFVFCFFFCENFIDNLRVLMLDDVVYIVL